MHIKILILIPKDIKDETSFINSELEKVSGRQSRNIHIDELEIIYNKLNEIKSLEDFYHLMGLRDDYEIYGFNKILDKFIGFELLDKDYGYIIHNSLLYTCHINNKILGSHKETEIWKKEYNNILSNYKYDNFVSVDVHI